MKTKKYELTATYEGIVPVKSIWGDKKYVGYDHLFTDVSAYGLYYSESRAKIIPVKIPQGATIKFTANFKSSILTKITDVRIVATKKKIENKK